MSTNALRAAATGQAPKTATIFDYFSNPKVISGLKAVASKHMTADRVLRLATNAINKAPNLLKCEPKSVLGAVMATTAIGLEPNTVQQLAFLIPYKRRAKRGDDWVDVYECQYQIGARGFRTLAFRSPLVQSLEAECVHAGDHFKHMQGSKAFLEFAKVFKDRGEAIGAYSHCILRNGFESACILPLDEILKIRSRSETWRTLMRNVEQAAKESDKARALEKLDDTPWVMWFDDMAAKSATKKHAKQLPLEASDALTVAAALDDAGDAGALDLGAMADPDVARSVVSGETEAPAILDDSEGQNERSVEAFGATARQAEKIAADAKPASKKEKAAAKKDEAPPKAKTYAEFAHDVSSAANVDAAAEILDLARAVLPPDILSELGDHYRRIWGQA